MRTSERAREFFALHIRDFTTTDFRHLCSLAVNVEKLGDVIFSTAERFAGSTKLADDLTVLALRRVEAPGQFTAAA